MFKANKSKNLIEILTLIKENFNNRLYLEVQRHNENEEKNYENFILNNSKNLNIPLIATQEVFYIDPEMYEAHDVLRCIGEKNLLTIKIDLN